MASRARRAHKRAKSAARPARKSASAKRTRRPPVRLRTENRERFPPSRVREAGMTGGEAEERDRITPDDAAPETLVNRESLQGKNEPVTDRAAPAADTRLSEVDESAIGAGGGRDEAENADREPIERAELQRIRKRVARSGGDLRNVEPAETSAGSPGRERNRDEEEGGSE
jgi:hypothetical protein